MFLSRWIHHVSILGAILETSFPNTACASQARRRSFRDSPPTDDDIDRAFTGVGPDQTIATMLPDRDFLVIPNFVQYIKGKSISEAFSPDIITYLMLLQFTNRDEYDALIKRLRLKLYRESSGTVWFLALDDVLYGPVCGTWPDYEFKALKDNPNVDKIMWNDSFDLMHKVLYWERGDLETDKSDSDELPIQRRPRESSMLENVMRVIGNFGATGAAAAIGGTDAAVGGAIGGTSIGVPGSITPTIQRPEKVDQENPGEITDVLPGIVGALPLEESPASDEQWEFEQQGIPERRSLNLRRRNICPPAHAERLFDPSQSQSPDIAPIQLHAESTSVPWTTVRITQHWNPYSLQGILGQYTVDVSLVDSLGNVIGSVTGAKAPNDEPVQVHSSLPLPFEVTMGAYLEDPVKLQYGQGRQWTSQDANHDCQQGQWSEDNKREVVCRFSVALEANAKNVLGG